MALFVVGALDLILTMYLCTQAMAREANPLMAYFLAHGPAALAAAKMAMVVCPLALLEWCRIRRPAFTRHAMRWGLAAYLLALIGGLAVQPAVQAVRHRSRVPTAVMQSHLTPPPPPSQVSAGELLEGS